MVEPTGANRDIALGGNPLRGRSFTGVKAFGVAPRIATFGVKSCPAWVACDAAFVADPADIRSGIAEHDRHGHEAAHKLAGVVPIVVGTVVNLALFSSATVEAIATVGTIEPNAKNVAVTG